MYLTMLGILLIPLCIIALIKVLICPRKPKCLENKHVVITGGSSGIGKSVAILAARKGANVTIIARNRPKLDLAQKEIENARIDPKQTITSVSVDVADRRAVFNELDNLETTIGPIYMLVNCAGMAICGSVEQFTEEDIKIMIDVNYLGTLFPIQNVIPKFKARKEGIVVLTASQAALMGIFGMSVYSSCKFALRGLAESIAMELKPYNVSVTLSLPPDTDTPGYENENKSKPEETKLISEAGGLYSPNAVAEKLLKDALIGNFFSYVGLDSFFLTTLCVGMSPFGTSLEVIWQAMILGPMRFIAACYYYHFDKIVNRCHLAKATKQ